LRSEGIAVQAFVPFDDNLDLQHLLDHFPDYADSWEIQTAGNPLPSETCLALLANCSRYSRLSLSTIVPGELIAGKQHPRTRLGFQITELTTLDNLLTASDLTLDSVLCRIDGTENPWTTVLCFRNMPPLTSIRRVDWLLTLHGSDDGASANLATEALLAMALLPDARLYVDPMLDLDRTMDVGHGLLDTRCNPRPVFHALRCLNTILHVHRATWTPLEREECGIRVLGLRSQEDMLELFLSDEPFDRVFAGDCLYRLAQGTVELDVGRTRIEGPLLIRTQVNGRTAITA